MTEQVDLSRLLMGNEWVSIVSQAKQIRKSGLDGPRVIPDSRVKQELYALEAVIIDRIVQRAYDEKDSRPPYGLVKLADPDSLFKRFYTPIGFVRSRYPLREISEGDYQTAILDTADRDTSLGHLVEEALTDTLDVAVDEELRYLRSLGGEIAE